MGRARIAVGEIVVFNIVGRRGRRAARAARLADPLCREIPIVHRVLSVHDRAVGSQQDVLTKGDNNFGDDKARPVRSGMRMGAAVDAPLLTRLRCCTRRARTGCTDITSWAARWATCRTWGG